jgi:hypothetical protein
VLRGDTRWADDTIAALARDCGAASAAAGFLAMDFPPVARLARFVHCKLLIVRSQFITNLRHRVKIQRQ